MFDFYQRFISPSIHALSKTFFGSNQGCRFSPTCSQYSKEAIKKYGIIHGVWLSIKRLSKCNPFHQGGHGPLH